ncbi:hypothetical protein K9L27_03715 [Candidatus Gracilibacteria bacterium]|nr:hypothetical protein [Candidatus Gracilibacteria bacterium]
MENEILEALRQVGIDTQYLEIQTEKSEAPEINIHCRIGWLSQNPSNTEADKANILKSHIGNTIREILNKNPLKVTVLYTKDPYHCEECHSCGSMAQSWDISEWGKN